MCDRLSSGGIRSPAETQGRQTVVTVDVMTVLSLQMKSERVRSSENKRSHHPSPFRLVINLHSFTGLQMFCRFIKGASASAARPCARARTLPVTAASHGGRLHLYPPRSCAPIFTQHLAERGAASSGRVLASVRIVPLWSLCWGFSLTSDRS